MGFGGGCALGDLRRLWCFGFKKVEIPAVGSLVWFILEGGDNKKLGGLPLLGM